ncbi:hypothetical protein [Candidatus Ichthyocystis hellenicum]|uniref:hypothetical protein n=1 Tax=Candidatus Ichthyocystis hellenicum TaxID=1561003 RepID=UPI001111D5B0|nr:hypothetical protein [Candidatus Ichthyocystis hellenicum]
MMYLKIEEDGGNYPSTNGTVANYTIRTHNQEKLEDCNLAEVLRSAIVKSHEINRIVDDESLSLSRKARDILNHLHAINEIIVQIEDEKAKNHVFIEKSNQDILNIDISMSDALKRFRNIDFLKGVSLPGKPRIALQKKKYVDEIFSQLRILHDHISHICGCSEWDSNSKNGRRFISDVEIMESVDIILGEIFRSKKNKQQRHITPQVVWVLACMRLGRYVVQDMQMKPSHHRYISHIIQRL